MRAILLPKKGKATVLTFGVTDAFTKVNGWPINNMVRAIIRPYKAPLGEGAGRMESALVVGLNNDGICQIQACAVESCDSKVRCSQKPTLL